MAKWRLAKSLEKLRSQINAAHPTRSKASDGSIGDAAHSSRASDHNPDSQGRVCAIDVTHDPANGVDGKELSKSLIADSRMKYVIFAGKIFKARTKKWETYTGPNKHDKHVHVSVQAASADDAKPWEGLISKATQGVPANPKGSETVELPTDMPGDVTIQATASEPEKITAADMQGVVTGHSDSVRSIVSRAGLKVVSLIMVIWTSGIAGKAFLIVVGLILVFAAAYEVNKYWPKFKPWAVSVFKGFSK